MSTLGRENQSNEGHLNQGSRFVFKSSYKPKVLANGDLQVSIHHLPAYKYVQLPIYTLLQIIGAGPLPQQHVALNFDIPHFAYP